MENLLLELVKGLSRSPVVTEASLEEFERDWTCPKKTWSTCLLGTRKFTLDKTPTSITTDVLADTNILPRFY